MPNSKVQIQSCGIEFVSCYQRRPAFFFLFFFCTRTATAQRPPTVSGSLFVLTNEGCKLMWKDMLIIIHLPSNYTLGLPAINHALCFFFLSLPPSLSHFQFDSSPPCRSSSTRWWRSSHQGAASRQHQPHTDTQRRRRKKTICWLAVSSLFLFLVCHFYTLHVHHIQACVEVLLLVWQNVLIVAVLIKVFGRKRVNIVCVLFGSVCTLLIISASHSL